MSLNFLKYKLNSSVSTERVQISRLLEGLTRGPYTAKYYSLVSLLSVVSKVFEKPANNRIADHLEKCGFFLIPSMVLGVLNQLQILLQLYLIELLGFLTGLGLLLL